MDYSRLVEALRREGSNKNCFDCGVVGTTYASLNFGTFVCSQCAGILRGLNFKVKAIGISIFTLDEYEFLQRNGNDKAKNVWLGNFDPYRYQRPNPKNYEEVKEHIIKKYKEKKFYKESKGIRIIKSTIEDDIRDPLDFVDRCRIKNIDIGPSWLKKKDVNEGFDFSNNNNNVTRKNNFIQVNSNKNNNNVINSKKINDFNMNKNVNNSSQNKSVDLLGGLLDIGQEGNNNNTNLGNQDKKGNINDLFDGFNFNGNTNNNITANLTNNLNTNTNNNASNTNNKNDNNLGFDFNSFGNDLQNNNNDDNFLSSQKKEEPQNDNFGFDFGDEKPQNEIKKDSNNILDLGDNNQKINDLLDFSNNKQNISENNDNKNNILDLNSNTSNQTNQANQAMNNNNNDNFGFNFDSTNDKSTNIGFNLDFGQQNQTQKNDNNDIIDNLGFDFGEQPQMQQDKKEENIISNLNNDKNGNLGLDLDFGKQPKEKVKEPDNINQLFEDPNSEKINDMRKIQEMKRNKDYQDLTVALDNQNQLDQLNQGKLDIASITNTQSKIEEQAKENSLKEEANLNFNFDKFLNTQQNNN